MRGSFHSAVPKPLAAYMTEPPFLRWAKEGAAQAEVLLMPEDVALQREGKPAKWKQPIIGMPASGRKPV